MSREIKLVVSLKEWDNQELQDELEKRGLIVYSDEPECAMEHLEDASRDELIDALDDERLRLFAEKMEMLNLDQWRAIFNTVEQVPVNDRKNFAYDYHNLTAKQ